MGFTIVGTYTLDSLPAFTGAFDLAPIFDPHIRKLNRFKPI